MLGHRKLETSDYLAILKRRRWTIILPIVILPIVAVISTFFIQPQYLSQTLVLIDQQKVPDTYVKSVIATDLDSRLSSMKEQILSRSRIEPIINHYNLYGNQRLTMDEKIDLARKNISVKPIKSDITVHGGLPGFFIAFTAGDARTAQLVCGEITALFVNENLRSREASAEGTTDFLKGQLDDAKHSLDEQDQKLAEFQRQYVGKLPGEEAPNMNMLTSMNTQLEAATQALAQMEQNKVYQESMLSQITSNAPTTVGVAPPSNVPNPLKETKQTELRLLQKDLGDLEAQYTADHPDVISTKRKIADLQRTIATMPDTVPASSVGIAVAHVDPLAVQQLRAQIKSQEIGIAAKRHEQEMIQSRIGMYQERISASPLVDQEYKQLTRDYDTAKKFYDDLLTKMESSKMATDLERRQQGEQFHVMDQPNLPDAPIFPKRSLFAAGGLILGFVLAGSLAVLAEFRDTALRTERDVWAFTQLPTLAVIGFIDGDGANYPSQGDNNKSGWRFWRKKSDPGATASAGA